MIPKKIHYCWFGGNPKSKLIQKCIASWKKYLPDYEIIEWNESNFNIDSHAFIKKAYQEKHWAFVSDYARLLILKEHGGIYLDTDMEIVKSLNPLLENNFFIGKESKLFISAGIIGSSKNNNIICEILKEYDSLVKYKTIPKVITPIIEKYKTDIGIKVYEPEYFYPYNPYGDSNTSLMFSDITPNTYAIHHWEKSWDSSVLDEGTGICVFLKKIFSTTFYKNRKIEKVLG